MVEIDRRKVLRAGLALTIPLGGLPFLVGCQQSTDVADPKGGSNETTSKKTDSKQTESDEQTNKSTSTKKDKNEGKAMQVQYLEIVTSEVEALCKQYADVHGITFSDPIAGFGNARTAELHDGGMLGIRAPMRDGEAPVVRPYMLVDDLAKAVAAAKEAGAEVAIEKMEIPGGYGNIAIVIQGGIDCGLWQK